VHGYDYLVLATGSRYNYFGHADWPLLAPALKSLDHATLVRRRILLAFEEAEATADPALRRRLLTCVLVGAGPTGVELAGALAELARATLSRDFRHINPETARIILVEAGPRILAEFSEALAGFARRSLERMGVEIMTGTPIEAIGGHGVAANGQYIEAANVLWCAGVAATPVAQWLGLAAARGGRVAVGVDLSVRGHSEIFVVGDAALAAGPNGRPLPGLAAVAEQQGRYAARAIAARIAGAQASPFHYRNKGELATIGRSSAIADFGWIRLTGWVAWVLWGVVHIFFLIGFRNRLSVFLNWVWAWLTYGRGARLITGDTLPAAQPPTAQPPHVAEPARRPGDREASPAPTPRTG
ncbi:MAG: NAD(P)/FAD-dependent oxidoreductase, partial [Stellaceae bacterium]